MAGKKNDWKDPEGSDKNSINTFVTADPVAAGKRQEANSRSTVLCWGKTRREKSSPYIRKIEVRGRTLKSSKNHTLVLREIGICDAVSVHSYRGEAEEQLQRQPYFPALVNVRDYRRTRSDGPQV